MPRSPRGRRSDIFSVQRLSTGPGHRYALRSSGRRARRTNPDDEIVAAALTLPTGPHHRYALRDSQRRLDDRAGASSTAAMPTPTAAAPPIFGAPAFLAPTASIFGAPSPAARMRGSGAARASSSTGPLVVAPRVRLDARGSRDIHVVFLIDITGSMSCEIDAVKKMIDCFCKVNRLGLQLHIHTFTESDRGCYVTQSPVGLTQPQVANYVQTKLKLSNPPDLHVSAHGGDGPENHTAAIADLTTKFGKDANVVCFMITDATPHYKSHGASTEAKKEAEWLSNNGFETDIFKVLNYVVDSLNATFIPILFNNPDLTWYTQLAGLTRGLILFPSIRDSTVLSDALHTLLAALQARAAGEVSIDHHIFSNLSRSFRIVTPMEGEFVKLDEDPDRLGSHGPGSAPFVSSDIYTRREDAHVAVPAMLDRAMGRFGGGEASRA